MSLLVTSKGLLEYAVEGAGSRGGLLITIGDGCIKNKKPERLFCFRERYLCLIPTLFCIS